MESKYYGIISAYFPSRKYGFIQLEDGTCRFFHLSNYLAGTPILGQKVEFELADPVRLGQNKQATNIAPVLPSFDEVAR